LHAVILERNKLVGRRVARLFLSAGLTAETIDDPAQLAATQPADVLCADTFDGDLVAERVRATGARGVLWTAEPLKRSLKFVQDTPSIDHVLGRRDFESPPRSWEVVMVARRMIDPGAVAPLSAFVDWGAIALEVEIRTPADRDACVERIGELIASLQAPRRIAEMFGELGHELIMNAMYGAPVDSSGRAKYAARPTSALPMASAPRSDSPPTAAGSCCKFAIRSAGYRAITSSAGWRAGSRAASRIDPTAARGWA
jgi:hypothetical protein